MLVHLWEEYSDRTPEKLNGMFAFSIWDADAETLFVARGRLGVKPLYYADTDEEFRWACGLHPLLRAGVGGALDEAAVYNYFSLRYSPGRRHCSPRSRSSHPGPLSPLHRPRMATTSTGDATGDSLRTRSKTGSTRPPTVFTPSLNGDDTGNERSDRTRRRRGHHGRGRWDGVSDLHVQPYLLAARHSPVQSRPGERGPLVGGASAVPRPRIRGVRIQCTVGAQTRSYKSLLTAAVSDIVPARTLERDKHGFDVPVAEWFRDRHPAIERWVTEERVGRTPWLEPTAVFDLYAAHRWGDADHAMTPWKVLTYVTWYHEFVHGAE